MKVQISDLTNAGQEFLEDTKGTPVKCAKIIHGSEWDDDRKEYILKLNYTQSDFEDFINALNDVNYDSGYGGQRLFGLVWFEDGTWLSRGEYDGSEWWIHNSLPQIPKDCL
jgi:hypothetical protein